MNETVLFTTQDIIFNQNQDPDHNAIESPGYQPLTYHDLRQQVLTVVKTLNAMGFHRNDRIAVIMPAGPETACPASPRPRGIWGTSLYLSIRKTRR